MQYTVLVGVLNGLGDRLEVARRAPRGQGLFPDQFGQIPAFDKLHRIEVIAIVFPEFKDRDNVGMVQAGHGLRLGPETAHRLLAGKRALEHDL
jgi:hypothetical protein